MKDFNHINVLTLIGISFENSQPIIILPFMENGDLESYLRNNKNKLKVDRLLDFVHQVAKGITLVCVYIKIILFIH